MYAIWVHGLSSRFDRGLGTMNMSAIIELEIHRNIHGRS